MKTDLRGLEANVRSTRTETVETLDRIKQESESLNDKIVSQNEKITVELNKGLAGQMIEISSVKKTTDELQQENEAMKKELAKIRHTLASIADPSTPQASPEFRKTLVSDTTSLSDAYARARIIRYTITLPASGKTVDWLLPVILE